MNNELEQMASKINAALADANYKLEALTALQHQAETLPMRQMEAFTDLQNLLARFMERD